MPSFVMGETENGEREKKCLRVGQSLSSDVSALVQANTVSIIECF